ncbi:hypothetical protein, partial [Listeria monocytogenes]|uniref:hypothetical protein n=1 Tax=Listeria monocytogenes TaxID=1639 RepID=UPI001432B752
MKLDKFAVEDKINEKYGQLLFQTKNNPQLYELRLEELFKYIQFDLLDVIGQRKPYLCGLNRFHTYLENVIQRININDVELNYAIFKKDTPLFLEEIKNKREYKQLAFCKDDEKFISKHIM